MTISKSMEHVELAPPEHSITQLLRLAKLNVALIKNFHQTDSASVNLATSLSIVFAPHVQLARVTIQLWATALPANKTKYLFCRFVFVSQDISP